MTTDEKEPVRLVFAGQRLDANKKKTFNVWYLVDDDGNVIDGENALRSYPSKSMPYCRPGLSYVFDQAKGTTSIYPNTARDGKRAGTDEQIAKWQAEQAAACAVIEGKKIANRLAKEGVGLDELVGPIARVYRKLPFSARATFLGQVIVKITKGDFT